MLIFVGIFVISLLVWIWHYITPWGWLNTEQLSKIQSVLFSGSVSAMITAFMKKQLDK